MTCSAMGYFVLPVLAVASVAFLRTQVVGNINCVQPCSKRNPSINCSTSLILISDVTNLWMNTSHQALENIKRNCMGRGSCDFSRTCSTEQPLIVHYSCVNASLSLSKECSWPGVAVNGSYGNIQSYAYPAPTNITKYCQWKIAPGSGHAVVISLNDFVFNEDKCEDVLMMRGYSCDGKSQNLRSFCGKDNITRMVFCDKVEIQLRQTNRQLRFWLSFHVWPKDKVPRSDKPVSRCPDATQGGRSWQDNSFTTEASVSPGTSSPDSNTEVLVIMLSIISGISAVLLIILIVVCVRCRLLQASRAEFAPSDPSASMPAHYIYISTSEPEKPRPQLADGYFQVSDALHFAQSVESPLTPAYAEVEQFPELKENRQSSSSEDFSRGSNSLSVKNQHENVFKNADKKQKVNLDVSVVTPRSNHGVIGRLKKEKIKKGNTDNKTVSRNLTTSLKSEAGLGKSLVPTLTGLHSRASSDEDGTSNYETIGQFSPPKTGSSFDDRPQVPPNHPQSRTLSAKLLPTFSENTYNVINSNMNTDCDNRTDSPMFRNKTLPSRNSKAVVPTSQTNNNGKRPTTYKDMPKGSGIVKNGIKKFEQNST